MTAIIITVCLSIVALVGAIIFVPGVASALMAGLGLGMFRAIGENRAKRIAERRKEGRGPLGFRRLRLRQRLREPKTPPLPIEPATPPEPPPAKTLDEIETEMLGNERRRRIQRLRDRIRNR